MVAMAKKFMSGYIAWTQFVAELYARFDTDTRYLGHLTKLKQSGTVEDFITALSFGLSNKGHVRCILP
jgi:hypothetical protein